MRRVLLILMVIQASLMFGAQFEKVSEAKENPMHMGLYDLDDIQKLDDNGKVGALVIVNCGLEDVFFQSLYGKIYQTGRSGQYRIVLRERTQYFVIQKEGFANHKYMFPTPLKSGTVYEMTVDEKNKEADTITLVISSNQDNASVYVKEELVGQTENRFFTIDLPLGNNDIELRKSGYKSKKITHNLSPENNKVELNLEVALPTPVTITTEPAGAIVYIDNVLFGTSPKSSFFAEGSYPIRIEKESYATIDEEISISDPETKKNYKLKDIRATLTIKTNPQATVTLNGTSYKGGIKDLKLNPQTINVKVEQEFCETINERFNLERNEVKVVDMFPQDVRATLTIKTNPQATVTL
ncbi:PEGA domain-containing protein, partial [bacterium]|nr:PEGA domain-containing protein [bacterium]